LAKYDHGGGCPCGLQKVCDCKPSTEPGRKECLSCVNDGYEMREYFCTHGKHCEKDKNMGNHYDSCREAMREMAAKPRYRAVEMAAKEAHKQTALLRKVMKDMKEKQVQEKDFDFGFTTEESLTSVPDKVIVEKLEGLRDLMMPLLTNLLQNPEMDIIKWKGADRVKQINTFMEKMNNYIYG
jgi:hypothetical protein